MMIIFNTKFAAQSGVVSLDLIIKQLKLLKPFSESQCYRWLKTDIVRA